MAKGGGGGIVLLAGAAGVAALLFLTGTIPGYGSGAPEVDANLNAGDAADKAAEGAKGAADAVAASPTWFEQHPGVLPVLICLLGAGVAIRFWRGLNGFARATILVIAAAVAAVVFSASR
jgi:hypothetical protein